MRHREKIEKENKKPSQNLKRKKKLKGNINFMKTLNVSNTSSKKTNVL